MIIRQLSAIVVVPVITVVFVTALGCQFPVDRAAKDAFRASLGETTITVFPAFVRSREGVSHDRAAAERIGAFFADKNLAEVNLSETPVPTLGPSHRVQSRILSESAEAFALYVKGHPVAAEYALLPEYLMGRSAAGGIHCYIVDSQSRLVYVVLQNSHWPIFAEVKPKSVDDCTEVLIRVLEDDLLPGAKRVGSRF